MKELFDLYVSFFKMGAVTFGGGYAMLPILQREAAENKKWLTNEKIMDFYAVAQGLPGIIAVNVSVFIGYERRKILGGIAAAFGVVSPSVIVITVIAAFLSNIKDNVYLQHALSGITVCVCALIFHSVLGLAKKGIKDALGIVLCIATFALTEFTGISPVLIIIGAAAAGIAMQMIYVRGAISKGGDQLK